MNLYNNKHTHTHTHTQGTIQSSPSTVVPQTLSSSNSRVDPRQNLRIRMRDMWSGVVTPVASEYDSQKQTNDKLLLKHTQLGDAISSLKSDTGTMEMETAELKRTIAVAQTTLETAAVFDPPASEIVRPADSFSSQLVHLCAETAAQEEMMDELSNLYSNKTITLKEYLEAVRDTSTEQFWSKKLLDKVVFTAKRKHLK
eukprot:GHVR01173630.1.p1 GENE.GHVR01173630.1~~GHVR01173630.1.p1  ORF type:complete len:199 (+),score=68.56 GHVR01173630.1:611-1207(+)